MRLPTRISASPRNYPYDKGFKVLSRVQFIAGGWAADDADWAVGGGSAHSPEEFVSLAQRVPKPPVFRTNEGARSLI